MVFLIGCGDLSNLVVAFIRMVSLLRDGSATNWLHADEPEGSRVMYSVD